jgi:hypothetical protein
VLSGRKTYGEAYFDLTPALPSAVWTEIGGLRLGDLDHAAIDAGLDRLRHSTSVEDRLWVLRQLVTYWHGPIHSDDGFSEKDLEGLAIPYPLRWWYRWAGRRKTIMSGQNFLHDPGELRLEGDKLLFYIENQGCYFWGTDPEGDDSPVFGRYEDSDPWQREGIALSEHLILACLFEAVMCHSPYGASAAWLPRSVLEQIIEHVPPIPIAPWGWGEMRFYAGAGAYMIAAANGEIDGSPGYSVWIGAKTEHPLQVPKGFIDDGWEYVAV